MPRLETTEQLMEIFGKELPNPNIDSIRLQTLTDDDPIYTELSETTAAAAATVTEGFSARMLEAQETITNDVLKIEVLTSISINTEDGFDANALAKELFQVSTSNDDTDNESLYINIMVAKSRGYINDLKSSKAALKRNLTPSGGSHLDDNDEEWVNILSEYGILNATSALNRSNYFLEMVDGIEFYVISLPFSDYYDRVKFTTTFDSENNPIITISEIAVPVYIKNFATLEDLTLFATVSIGDPQQLGGGVKLNSIAYAMNFSDVVYEDVKKDGQIATLGDVIYLDQYGIQYSNLALRGLNRKYYKIDNFGPVQIRTAVRDLLSEYASQATAGTELEDVINGIEMVMHRNMNNPEMVEKLKVAGRLFPQQSGTSPVARLYSRYRRLIININSLLQQEDEVVKRIYKNYKIVDERVVSNPTFDSISYVAGAADLPGNFLYRNVWQTNVANFVPIRNVGDSWPGKAELSHSPSERKAMYRDKLQGVKQEIYRAAVVSWAGKYKDGWAEVDLDSLSEAERKYTTPIAALNTVIDKLFRWVYNVWAARFVRESVTGFGPNHTGMRYYECKWASGGNRGCERKDLTCPQGHKDSWATMWHYWKTTHGGDQTAAFGAEEARPAHDQGLMQEHIHYTVRKRRRVYNSTNKEFEYEYYDADETQTRYIWDDALRGKCTRNTLFSLQKWICDGRDPLQVFVNRTQTRGKYEAARAVKPESDHATLGDNSAWRYQEEHFDFVGSINPMKYLTFDTGFGDRGYLSAFDIDMYWKAQAYELDNINKFMHAMPAAVCIMRRHPNPIKEEIAKIVMSLLGVEPWQWQTGGQTSIAPYYTEGSNAGPRLYLPPDEDDDGSTISYAPAGSYYVGPGYAESLGVLGDYQATLVDYFPDNGGASGESEGPGRGTNDFTRMDEYFQDLPHRIVHSCIKELENSIENDDIESLLTPDVRASKAAALTTQFYDNLRNFAKAYIEESGMMTIYIVNRLPSEIPKYITFSRDMYGGSYGRLGAMDYEAIYEACSPKLSEQQVNGYRVPHGSWQAETIQRNDSSGDGRYDFQGGYTRGQDSSSASDTDYDDYIALSIADPIVDYFLDRAEANKATVETEILRYLELVAAFEGDTTNTGIHSALSEVDIIVKKYGYFFFDLEKYIRKASVASEVMNMDRFMQYMPAAKDITNQAINLKEVYFKSEANSENHPDNPDAGQYNGLVEMTLRMSPNGYQNSLGYDTAGFSFNSPAMGTGMTVGPGIYAYSKVHTLQGITFSQITDYTHRSTGGFKTLTPGSREFDIRNIDQETYEGDAGGTAVLAGRDEVNMDGANGLLTHPDHRPQDFYSNLSIRNFGFPGFADSSLPGTQTRWASDYRMHMFRYQYFVDDDTAINNTGFGYGGDIDSFSHKYGDANSPQDDITLRTKICDNSDEIITALRDYFNDIYTEFVEQYYDLAVEHCAFDDYTYSFNAFFVEEMLRQFPSPQVQPWYKMIAIHHSLINLFADAYNGSEAVAIESANSMLEQIRPETGTLAELERYKILVEEFSDLLDEAAASAAEVVEERGGSYTAEHEVTLRHSVRIIDHVGDYTVEDEALSEIFEI